MTVFRTGWTNLAQSRTIKRSLQQPQNLIRASADNSYSWSWWWFIYNHKDIFYRGEPHERCAWKKENTEKKLRKKTDLKFSGVKTAVHARKSSDTSQLVGRHLQVTAVNWGRVTSFWSQGCVLFFIYHIYWCFWQSSRCDQNVLGSSS